MNKEEKEKLNERLYELCQSKIDIPQMQTVLEKSPNFLFLLNFFLFFLS